MINSWQFFIHAGFHCCVVLGAFGYMMRSHYLQMQRPLWR